VDDAVIAKAGGSGFNARVTYRFWFYFCKTAPPTMILGWIGVFMLADEPGEGVTAHLGTIWTVVFALLFVMCLWLGIRIQRRRLRLRCPFCLRLGPADLERSEGLTMECPACGDIRGQGALGWTIRREGDPASCGPPPSVPVPKMQFRSPWFWGVFGLSVASAVCGAVIHEFGLMTLFAPLWCFLVAGHLVQTVQTGCLNDNTGPAFRDRQPVRYWRGTVIWCLGYCLAVYIPIGYALQERDKAKPKAEAAANAKR
jgi:hypothetical protein